MLRGLRFRQNNHPKRPNGLKTLVLMDKNVLHDLEKRLHDRKKELQGVE